MNPEEWIWDDPDIDGEDYLYRRVKRVPHLVVTDPRTRESTLLDEAFKYDTASGVSVSIASIAEAKDISIADLTTWSTHGVAFVKVAVARTDRSGVVAEATDDDPSHGLIRVASLDKAEYRDIWLPLRNRLALAATYIDSPADIAGSPTSPTVNISRR